MSRPDSKPTASTERQEADAFAGGFGRRRPHDGWEALPSLDGPTWRGGHLWLLAAVGAASVVVAVYLTTHTHPAYEGGLYLEMAEAIRLVGWDLPWRVGGYTVAGVPFAYPPLLFYALAGIEVASGADPVTMELYLPGLFTVACLYPYWRVARELLPAGRQAGLATFLYAVTPAVLQWHLSAGGIVRAPAMFLTLWGLYTGIRLFRDGGRGWLLASTALFGLVVLSHPVYAAFFGLSYLVLFAGLDRSWHGLTTGATVAAGGAALTAPWWLTVTARHGRDVFLDVNGTRSTIGAGLDRIVQRFGHPIGALDPITPFYVAVVVGGVYAASRRRFLLPAWLVVASYGLGEARFTFVVGSMLSATLLVEALVPSARTCLGRIGASGRLGAAPARVPVTRLAVVVVLGVAMGWSGVVGAAYAGSALDTAYVQGTTMPQTVGPDDLAAMAWVDDNTRRGAEFVVLGDSAEWFPHYTERTILLSPWGTEWTSPGTFRFHVRRYEQLSSCESRWCLAWNLSGVPGEADYLYVPKRGYTIRGREYGPPSELLAALHETPRTDTVFENDGVVIFEVDGSLGRPSRWGAVRGPFLARADATAPAGLADGRAAVPGARHPARAR